VLKYLFGPYSDCPTDLHKLNNFESPFAAFVLGYEGLVPTQAARECLLGEFGLLPGSDQQPE
jgi:hypothetical protein